MALGGVFARRLASNLFCIGAVVEGVRISPSVVQADYVAPARTHDGYHEFVAAKMLAYNRSLALPQWLLQWFKDGRHDALLRIYLQYGRLEEAGKLALDLIYTLQQTAQQQNIQQNLQQILPELLLENLIVAIKTTASNWDEGTNGRLHRVAEEVKRAVNEFYYRNDIASQ